MAAAADFKGMTASSWLMMLSRRFGICLGQAHDVLSLKESSERAQASISDEME